MGVYTSPNPLNRLGSKLPINANRPPFSHTPTLPSSPDPLKFANKLSV